jgi:hypothetical protein
MTRHLRTIGRALLDRLQGKSTPSVTAPKEYVRITLPEPNYTLFNADRSGLPEVVVVNEALLSFQHTKIFPWHLEVTIEAKNLAEQGMPTSEESGVLFEFGDRIEQTVLGGNALFLARSTWNGIRQLLFRIHDPEIAHVPLQAILAEQPPIREWRHHMEHDREWALAGPIFKLFPLAKGNNA